MHIKISKSKRAFSALMTVIMLFVLSPFSVSAEEEEAVSTSITSSSVKENSTTAATGVSIENSTTAATTSSETAATDAAGSASTVKSVTNASELEYALNDENVIAIQIATSFTYSEEVNSKIPITVKSGYYLMLSGADNYVNMIIESGASLYLSSSGRITVNGYIENNGTISNRYGTHWLRAKTINNGTIECINYSTLYYDYGCIEGEGTVPSSFFKCNIAASCDTKPTITYSPNPVYAGDTVELALSGALPGVDLKEIGANIRWYCNSSQIAAAANQTSFAVSTDYVGKTLEVKSISLKDGYTIITPTGSYGSLESISICIEERKYDTVYVSGVDGDNTNTGESEDKPLADLQSAMSVVSDGGKVILLSDCDLLTQGSGFASQVDLNKNLTVCSVQGQVHSVKVNYTNAVDGNFLKIGADKTVTFENVIFTEKPLEICGDGVTSSEKSTSSLVIKGQFGPLSRIYNLDSVTLDGANVSGFDGYDFEIRANTLNINNASVLDGTFYVDKLTSAGESSTIICSGVPCETVDNDGDVSIADMSACVGTVNGVQQEAVSSVENPINLQLSLAQVEWLHSRGRASWIINFSDKITDEDAQNYYRTEAYKKFKLSSVVGEEIPTDYELRTLSSGSEHQLNVVKNAPDNMVLYTAVSEKFEPKLGENVVVPTGTNSGTNYNYTAAANYVDGTRMNYHMNYSNAEWVGKSTGDTWNAGDIPKLKFTVSGAPWYGGTVWTYSEQWLENVKKDIRSYIQPCEYSVTARDIILGEINVGDSVTFSPRDDISVTIEPNQGISNEGFTFTCTLTYPEIESTSDTQKIVSVDIEWGEMVFTYTDGSKGFWNPDTHRFDNPTEGGWKSNSVDGNKITVTNNGNVGVNVTYNYEQIDTAVLASFTDGTNTIDGPVLLSQNETEHVYLQLEGEPSQTGNGVYVGRATITIGE